MRRNKWPTLDWLSISWGKTWYVNNSQTVKMFDCMENIFGFYKKKGERKIQDWKCISLHWIQLNFWYQSKLMLNLLLLLWKSAPTFLFLSSVLKRQSPEGHCGRFTDPVQFCDISSEHSQQGILPRIFCISCIPSWQIYGQYHTRGRQATAGLNNL